MGSAFSQDDYFFYPSFSQGYCIHILVYMLVSMDITCAGTNGYLRLHDFVIPFQEKVASFCEASRVPDLLILL